jgi:outer membrane protein assembly factor BamB
VAEALRSRQDPPLSAPIAAGGLVFVAGTETGQIMAIDAATGKKVWTVTLGGRIDTPPTIHKGLCLIGCHDGWVYAFRAKDGQLAYRFRVAPWERRLADHGQIESVWPATGSVLVYNNTAFISAGRSTESDGGIAVMAFDPKTGKQIWSQAVVGTPFGKKANWRGRPNDLLFVRDGFVVMGNLNIDPKTGKLSLLTLPGWKLYKGGAPKRKLDETLGRHYHRFIRGRASADLMAWNDKLIAATDYAVTHTMAFPEDVKTRALRFRKKDNFLWVPQMRGYQVLSVTLASNAALYAGSIYTRNQPEKGFVRLLSLSDGKQISETVLPSPPVFDGMAVAGGKVYLSLRNGKLVCLGN